MDNLERLIIKNEKEQHELFQKLKEIRDRRVCLAKEHLKLRRQLLKVQLSRVYPNGCRIYYAMYTDEYDIISCCVRVFSAQEGHAIEWFAEYFSYADVVVPLSEIEITEESIEELQEWQIDRILGQLEDQYE